MDPASMLHLYSDIPRQTTRYGVRDTGLHNVLPGAYNAAFNLGKSTT